MRLTLREATLLAWVAAFVLVAILSLAINAPIPNGYAICIDACGTNDLVKVAAQ